MQPIVAGNAPFVVAEGKSECLACCLLPVPTRISLPTTGYRLLPDQFQ